MTFADVFNASYVSSKCFFNFCFKRVSNSRTNPQGDNYFGIDVSKKWYDIAVGKKNVYVCSRTNGRLLVFEYLNLLVLLCFENDRKYKIETVSKTN